MNETSEAVIIGAGPAGSFTALNLAQAGVKVTVFEEHNLVGLPCHCAGHLSIKGLARLGLQKLPPGIVENTFRAATFYSPSGREFSVRFPSPVTCSVNRPLLEGYLAEKAEEAGATYVLNSRVKSLLATNGRVEGVAVEKEARTEKKQARIVVDAEGVTPRILRRMGLSGPKPESIVNGVEAEAEKVDEPELDRVSVFLGRNYAPGFYAWLMPRKDGTAKIGLAARRGNPKELLAKLIAKHPAASEKMRKAKVLSATFHPITLGGPVPQTHAEGFLAVGDVSSQVKPTTGGGVVLGMMCAKLAADVAAEAVCENDFSATFLKAYQKRCQALFGSDFKIMLLMRRILNGVSDSKLDDALALCTKIGLGEVLSNVNDVDLQGRALFRMLRRPKVTVALGYFLWAYLSANL